MPALVYHGPNDKSWDEAPDAALIDDAYEVVANASQTGALKVVIERPPE
jgi:hypothetical protein